MKPKESFDEQKLMGEIQTSPLAPSKVTLMLGTWLEVTTDLSRLDDNGTIKYSIATSVYTLSGDTQGSTNDSDPKLQLEGKLHFGAAVGNISLSITSDLINQRSTAVVTVTFRGTGPQYSGIIASWGK